MNHAIKPFKKISYNYLQLPFQFWEVGKKGGYSHDSLMALSPRLSRQLRTHLSPVAAVLRRDRV